MNATTIRNEYERLAAIDNHDDRVAALDELMARDRTTGVHVEIELRHAGQLSIADNAGWRQWLVDNDVPPGYDDLEYTGPQEEEQPVELRPPTGYDESDRRRELNRVIRSLDLRALLEP